MNGSYRDLYIYHIDGRVRAESGLIRRTKNPEFTLTLQKSRML